MAEILVVDDDDAICGWLVAVLRAARHTVCSFGSAEEALLQVRKKPPADLGGVPVFPDGRPGGSSQAGNCATSGVPDRGSGGGRPRCLAPGRHRPPRRQAGKYHGRSANAFVMTDFGTAKRVRVDTTLTPDGRIIS